MGDDEDSNAKKDVEDMVIALANCAYDDENNPLVCYGCPHSIGGAPFPSGPSGERPCCFCIRNPKLVELNETNDLPALWYNGIEPVKVPMDCYSSQDMRDQSNQWSKEAAYVAVQKYKNPIATSKAEMAAGMIKKNPGLALNEILVKVNNGLQPFYNPGIVAGMDLASEKDTGIVNIVKDGKPVDAIIPKEGK